MGINSDLTRLFKRGAMVQILLIEDNLELAEGVVTALTGKYKITHVTSLAAADKHMAETSVNVVLLDVGLPDGSGFTWYENLQKKNKKNISVLFLTGESDLDNRLKGLELGASDYIVKPFYLQELLARIEIQVRNQQSQNNIRYCGNLKFELALQRVYQTDDNQKEEVLNLTPNEFKILSYLSDHKEKTVSRIEIVNNVWGPGISLSDKVVNTHISNLRKKLKTDRCKIIAAGDGYSLRISN